MAQIVQPITAKALNENNHQEINKLYKSTSINLFLICGLFFLLINLNINQGDLLIDEKYSQGISKPKINLFNGFRCRSYHVGLFP